MPNQVSNTSYNEANQMLSFNDKNIVYDNNGNMTSVTNSCGTTNYSWDARNRLTGISGFILTSTLTCSPLSASFKYDALNRRIEKTINGVTTKYLYDGLDIIQELNGDGTVKANYIRGLNIDEPLARIKADGTIRNYLTDSLGSVIALTDETGVVKTTYTYDAFGNTTVSGEASDNPFQYTGRENDGTGLYYYRARYYSPELQRFISEDPIGLAGGINQYAYVGNMPLSFKDPEGKGPIAVGICIGLIIYDTYSTKDTLDKLNEEILRIEKQIKDIEKSCARDGITSQKLDEITELMKKQLKIAQGKTIALAKGSAMGIPIAYFCYAAPELPF